MAFSVSSITAFTNETAQQLIKSAVLTGNTIDMVTVVPGIKYKETINILDNTITVADASCGFTSQGSVAFSQREIEVVDLEVKESLCEKTLEQYFMGQWMKAGSPKDEQLGAILGDSYVEKIKEYNELGIWKGGTYSFGTTASYSNKINGFINKLGQETTRVTATSSTSFTSATIIAGVDAMVSAIPEDILDKNDLTLFLPYSFYMLYTNALRVANLYQGNVGDNANYETTVPGTNIKVKATKGLTGTGWMVLTFASNLVVGTDLMNEEEKFDIWYSKDNDEVRVNIQWKIGTQIQFPAHVVCNF
jgi:hypothetical protein